MRAEYPHSLVEAENEKTPMPSYLQKHRPLQVTTSLGEETLLVIAFRGTEQLSRLFSFELDLIADNSTVIDFSKLVGNDISLRVATPGEGDAIDWQYISGICARFTFIKRAAPDRAGAGPYHHVTRFG